jgi:hypothetical protein
MFSLAQHFQFGAEDLNSDTVERIEPAPKVNLPALNHACNCDRYNGWLRYVELWRLLHACLESDPEYRQIGQLLAYPVPRRRLL